MTLETSLTNWKSATSELPWGLQRTLHEVLEAVKDGQVHLVHGADYRDGKPCLINAVAQMVSQNAVTPVSFAPSVVQNFDRINASLQVNGVNDNSGYVSPLAAEILLRNFGELKEQPVVTDEAAKPQRYIERSDHEFAEWLSAMSAPAPEQLDEPATDDIDRFNKDYIKGEK